MKSHGKPHEDNGRRLRIAAQRDTAFARSIPAAGHELVVLPDLPDTHFNRSLSQRISDGQLYRSFLENNPVDLLIDLETSAMTFVPAPTGDGSYTMTHAAFSIPYVAHYADPVTETMQQVDWSVRWRLLEHDEWIKWVWDAAHAAELRALGATNVLSMPMAVVDDDYPTEPLTERSQGAPIRFIGQPATSWFGRNIPTQPAGLRPGFIAAACDAGCPGLTFHQIYYELYGMAEPPRPDDPPQARANKAANYFSAKLGYNIYLAIKQRDRFVLFLKNILSDRFELIGDHWQECLGLPHTPAIRGSAALTKTYRDTAINLNLIKGNAETGLNQRHFEITAAGGFMLTYKTAELDRYFDVDKECVTFENEQDLLEKIRYYLAHPKERIEIAYAGQQRTLREHLYSHRLKKLVSIIETASGETLTSALPRSSAAAPVGP